MAHYSVLNEDNIVTAVLSGIDETELIPWLNPETKLIEQLDPETFYSKQTGKVCKRTSFNTKFNTHLNNKTPFRGNFGVPGFTYNEELDAFLPPKPFESAVLDTSTFSWKPPVEVFTKEDWKRWGAVPSEDYSWNEATLTWEKDPPREDLTPFLEDGGEVYRWNSVTSSWEKED